MKMWVSSKLIAEGFFGLMARHFGKNQSKRVMEHIDELQGPYQEQFGIDVRQILTTEVKTIWDLDEKLTSKINGYGTADNYYNKASCIH